MDRQDENERMIGSYVEGESRFLGPVPLERVAGFIREPVAQEAVWVPEDVQRESILEVCDYWDLRLTRIHHGSWYRPSGRSGGGRGPERMPLVEEPGIDELARAIRHGAITAVVVSHIGVIGTLRQTREEFYRILRSKGDAQSGDSPRGARLVVSDFIYPAPRLMTGREWVKRDELVWQGPIWDTLFSNLTCASCGMNLEPLTRAKCWAEWRLGRGHEAILRGYGADPETVTQPTRDGEPDDEWATLQAEYRLALTSAWLGAHVQLYSQRLSKQLYQNHLEAGETANQIHSIVMCPCTERSMLRGEFSEMSADRIGRTSIALDDPNAVRFTNPEYPWDRLPRLVTASMRNDPGRVVKGILQ